MGRGLFSGIVWGIVVTGLVLVVLALVGPAPDRPGESPVPRLADRPPAPAPVAPTPEAAPAPAVAPAPAADRPDPQSAPATDIELPPGSEFNRPPPERAASLPEAEVEPRGAPPVRGPEARGALSEAPLPDTAPSVAPDPVTTVPDGMTAPLSAEAPPDLAAEEPVQSVPGVAGPATLRTGLAPDAPDATPAARDPDAAPDPRETVPAGAAEDGEADQAMPEVQEPGADAPTAPRATAADDGGAGAPDEAPDEGGLPRVRPLPGDDAQTPEGAAPAPGGMAGADESGAVRVPAPGVGIETMPDIRIGRLPTVGGARPEDDSADAAPAPEIAAQMPDAPEAPAAEGARIGTLGALARNAVPFDPPDDRPLFSVILIDAGEAGLDRETLMTFSFPVTFAIDPTRADAAEAMAAYRDAGYEVVALASALPDRAEPADLEVALTAQAPLLDRAVAVMDVASGGFQDDRALTAQMVAFAGATGHGLVTYDRGLNSAARLAGQSGVPQATIFRMLDESRPNAPTIRRMLDRAVFKARQDGHVVMVGHSYSDTVTALYSWALEAEAEAVTLAPVSAVLRMR